MPKRNKEQSHTEKPRLERDLEREENVVHIYKPEGTYTVIYGEHDTEQDPKDLPENLDGLFLL